MEESELARLFDDWASRLLPYMTTITKDRGLAEDALQNLFVKLATSRPDLRDPGVYLFRAARNEALRMARRRPGSARALSQLVAPRDPADPGPDVEGVASALKRLPPEQLEVVVLHAFEGLTFQETSQVLSIPPDTAASRYRYALEKLKELL
ncbi:MAG TPA: sigma-70 family RNA polymerase sigma factor [Planctomycetota bacterium]|nr:sigma-70 family RNA polymerase sigma factor [Planctomycetota bacterium]